MGAFNACCERSCFHIKLILAEKKQLGDLIAQAIPGTAHYDRGATVKGEYVIVCSQGHLLSLKEPEDYDVALGKWELSALPIYFPNWQTKVKEYNGRGVNPNERVSRIGELLKQCSCVIHAGDPDEEGQLLIDELLRWHGYRGPVYRLATGDTSIPALQRALNNLKDNRLFENMGWSAYARSVADLMVGVNMSRYYSLANNASLTVGRVQSPTLGLVVERDMLIENHVKTKYYEVSAKTSVEGKVVETKYRPKKDDSHLTDGLILERPYAESKSAMISGKQFSGAAVTKKISKEQPPLPFDMLELQGYCLKHFGYKLDDTMEITQSLRDNYNAITYNRTQVRYLPENYFAEAPATSRTVIANINTVGKGNFNPILGMDFKTKGRCFDDSKIEAHFGIIPQNVNLDLNKMTERERNVYLAICKYYLIQFFPPAEKETTKLVVPLPDGATLEASSTGVLKPGYLVMMREGVDTPTALSMIPAGSYDAFVSDAQVLEKETNPPPRYTQYTLAKDMSRIAKYVTDPFIKSTLLKKDADVEENNGAIGTSATRDQIISGLISRGFLQEKGKSLISTPLGRELYRILPDSLRGPDLTALWWVIQEEIHEGKATPEKLEQNVLAMLKDFLQQPHPKVDPNIVPTRKGFTPIGVCPRCGGNIIEGKMGFGCSNWKSGCKFTIWKKPKPTLFQHITFTEKDVKNFLAGKPVHKAKLTKKDGGTFAADLVMDDSQRSDWGPNFTLQFNSTKPAGASSRSGGGRSGSRSTSRGSSRSRRSGHR